MDDFVAAIGTEDHHAVSLYLHGFPTSANVSEHQLIQMIGSLDLIVQQFPGVSQLEHKGELITWHMYEHLIWEVGESFRQVMKRHKRFRNSQRLFQAIEDLTSQPRFGKGRESFVMLMGQYGGKHSVPTLLALLQDREVSGHAVYALRRLGAEEAKHAVRPFLESEKTWVRNEARKYFEKINRQREGSNSA